MKAFNRIGGSGDVRTIGSSGPFSTLLHTEVDANLTGTAVSLREAAGMMNEERTRLVNMARGGTTTAPKLRVFGVTAQGLRNTCGEFLLVVPSFRPHVYIF
jgi:hypothetical protein